MGKLPARFSLPQLIPHGHFMALAPLDVWLRLLFRPRAAVPARFWPRLLFALLASTLVTFITLPERLLLALFRHVRPEPLSLTSTPVFILGYYRSGTTHLQYLLDQDPNLFSPKWFHALAPQGFIASWTLLRFALIPFMSATRLVDAMVFSPEAPAEDDFALNNRALASSLPGWAVLPQAHTFYDRFHDLKNLYPEERARWERYQCEFVRKLALLSGSRRLLLKSPSHTARVDALLELFPGAKFIHITRHPNDVMRSNLTMLQTTQRLYALQYPLATEQAEQRLVDQYLRTEERYLAARSAISQGNLAELRFEDLLADPVGEIKRVYRELDLSYTGAFEQRLLDYLSTVQSYAPNVHLEWTEEEERRLAPELAPLVEQFQHGQPSVPKVELPKRPARSRTKPALVAVAAALACTLVWLAIANATQNMHGWIVWPTGIAVGYSTLRNARYGSRTLGLWSFFLTLLVLLGVVFSNVRSIYFAAHSHVPLTALWDAALRSLTVEARLFWSFMGLMTAYRLGSRPHV